MNTKRFISAVAASAVLAVGAMASNANVAANGLGDFLIAPAFFATGGYNSNLRVINTDLDSSVLVRVVVRDSACSREVDFPILLSPGDVWDATISTKEGGVYIHSTDDSNYIPQITTEKGLNLTNTNPAAANGYQSGYVEFYPVAQFDEAGDSKVSKDVLRKRWDNLQASTQNTGAYDLNNAISSIGAKLTGVDDVLTGFVNVVNDTTVKASMTLPMTAISDVSDSPLSGGVISMAQNTEWVDYFPSQENTDATISTEQAILNALKSKEVMIPYSDGGANNMVLFTFPGDHICTTTQTRSYTVNIRDTEENRPLVPSPLPSYSLTNELASATPEAILAKYQIIDSELSAFRNGWISIDNMYNSHIGQSKKTSGKAAGFTVNESTASLIATQMKAVDVGGAVTTNWMYIPSR